MKKIVLLALLGLVFYWAGCKKKTKNSVIPHIDKIQLLPDSVKAGSSEDTALLTFHFTDGDADLGTDSAKDIYITRNVDSVQEVYAIPNIDNSLRDPDYGMDGNAYVFLQAADPILYPRQDSLHILRGDTITFDVFIKDQAGHESNHLTTPPIIIKP